MHEKSIVRPTVSVIIPAFRASRDIRVALDSVFAQTFADFEVIVVDDGSPDSAELKAAIAPYRSCLQFLEQPNRGAGAARNTGIRAARGRFIAFLDADDRWAPEFLARQVYFLEANRSCALVYSDALLSGETPLAGKRFMETAPSNGEVTLVKLIRQECNIILSTVVVRRRPLVAAGLFDETLRRGQDFELWLRLALRGATIRYQRDVLAERRARADGLSGDSITEIQRALNVLDRFGRANTLDGVARTALRIRMMALVDRLEIEQAKQRIVDGNFAAARYHLNASRERPWKLRLALMALQIAPRLMRGAYLRLRPASPARRSRFVAMLRAARANTRTVAVD
jgi:glycosyltransferase involved in cell wall biosynthesis